MKTFDINGEIGGWGYGSKYVSYMLDSIPESEDVTIKVTSYGGDVNQALKIKDLLNTRGNVTVEYVGFNASAATIIGHGAVRTKIHEDGMYLIHKASSWVDEWGQMNSDEIEAAIENLQKQKKDLEAVTLMIANDYVNSRGMEMSTVQQLMSEARWLTAKEAVEFGLVDELVPTPRKAAVITNQQKGLMLNLGYPVPEQAEVAEEEASPTWMATLISKIEDVFARGKETKQKVIYNMKKVFENIAKLQILNCTGESNEDGSLVLSAEQAEILDEKVRELGEKISGLESDCKKKTDELDEVLNKLSSLHASVAEAETAGDKIEALKSILDSAAVSPATPADESADETDECAVDEINNFVKFL